MRVPLHEFAGMSLGLELVVSIVLMSALGHWVDGKLGSAPIGMLLGFVLGVAAGFRGLMKYAQRMDRIARAQERAQADRDAKASPPTPPPDSPPPTP